MDLGDLLLQYFAWRKEEKEEVIIRMIKLSYLGNYERGLEEQPSETTFVPNTAYLCVAGNLTLLFYNCIFWPNLMLIQCRHCSCGVDFAIYLNWKNI